MAPEFLKAAWRPIRSLGTGLAEPFLLARFNRNIQVGRDKIEALTDTQLAPYLETEWSRAKDLDDKLQKLTAALSVAVTVGGLVATTILQDLNAGPAKYVTAVLFLSASLYLLGGVWLGFNGLRPKARWGYGAAFIAIAEGKDKVAARKKRIEALANFERDNLIRSNEASAATSAIRNGVLLFGAALIVGVAAASLGKSQPAAVETTAGSAPAIRINVETERGIKASQAETCAASTIDEAPPSPATKDLSADRPPPQISGRERGRLSPSGQTSGNKQTGRRKRDPGKDNISCVAIAPAERQAAAPDDSLQVPPGSISPNNPG